jgi:hypothetical protein
MTFHAGLNWIPLGLRDPFYTEAFLIGEPFFPGVLLERLPVTASHFDYILVRGMHPDVVHWVGEFALLEARGGGFGAFAVTARQPDE